MYSLAHGDPHYKRTDVNLENMPTYDEMKSKYASTTKNKYDEVMKAKPYLPKHHLSSFLGKNDSHGNNILNNTFLNKKA